jgi:hypothetical protein
MFPPPFHAAESARVHVEPCVSLTSDALSVGPDSPESVISRMSRSFAAPVVRESAPLPPAPPNQSVVVHVPVQYSAGSVSNIGGEPLDEEREGSERAEFAPPAAVGPDSTVRTGTTWEVTDSGVEALSKTLNSNM